MIYFSFFLFWISFITTGLFLLDIVSAFDVTATSSIQNLRPIAGHLYRSATLDNLSQKDAEILLKEVSTVIDLRNRDEIKKGERQRSEGSRYFYSTMLEDETSTSTSTSTSSSSSPQWIHAPLLNDIDSFWDETIRRMDAGTRLKATAETVFSAGALDRAAARHLEQGGLPALYTVMLASTAPVHISKILKECCRSEGPIIVHCQKGKDRTGVIAMLIQSCIGDSAEEIVKAYAQSGPLLNEQEMDQNDNRKNSGGGLVDWSHFRGSPERAMKDTLEWIQAKYGSIESYLDQVCGFGLQDQQKLKESVSMVSNDK